MYKVLSAVYIALSGKKLQIYAHMLGLYVRSHWKIRCIKRYMDGNQADRPVSSLSWRRIWSGALNSQKCVVALLLWHFREDLLKIEVFGGKLPLKGCLCCRKPSSGRRVAIPKELTGGVFRLNIWKFVICVFTLIWNFSKSDFTKEGDSPLNPLSGRRPDTLLRALP